MPPQACDRCPNRPASELPKHLEGLNWTFKKTVCVSGAAPLQRSYGTVPGSFAMAYGKRKSSADTEKPAS